jgi:hypothetical protein
MYPASALRLRLLHDQVACQGEGNVVLVLSYTSRHVVVEI